MYYIKVSDIVLDFDGDISMTLNNPIFSDEISYSLQFNVKDSVNNRKAFGFINRPDIADNKTRELNCQINAGSMTFNGTITVKFQGGNFACYFKLTGDFWSAIKDKYLSDIPFDKVIIDPEISYDDVQDFIDAYNTDDNDHPFVFPPVINKKTDSKFPVRVAFAELLNSLLGVNEQCSFVPYLYIWYIFRNIFERFGLPVTYSAFEKYKFLKRLVAASNYLINEFALDTTVIDTKSFMIKTIENSTDPVVETILPHNLVNYQFIKLSGYFGGNYQSRNIGELQLPGYFTEAANITGYFNGTDKIKNRIYQIELIYNDDPDNPGQQIKDEYRFKLLGDDFSALDLYERVFKDQITISHIAGAPGDNYLRIDVDDTSDLVMFQTYYIRCNERTCIMRILGIVDDEYYITVQTNLESTLGLTWTNPNIYELKYPLNPEDGTIYVLPSLLINTFKLINPANHVPYMKINDFIKEFENIGIFTFVRQSGAEIKLFSDIINSPEFDEISDITTEIKDIENPDIDGYNLKFTADGNDEFQKEKQPVQAIDPKYTIKNPMATKTDLSAAGSETNDIRLVIDENSYYVFNKSFLNADNNWKFLCYNLLDNTSGAGDLKITSKISAALPDILSGDTYDRMDIPCRCLTFDNDTNMNLRILSFYNINGTVYATSGLKGPDGNEISGSELEIRWEGEKGIINKLLKEKLEWETNVRKNMKAIVLWPESDLVDFDFSRKKRIRGVDYLVKSVKFVLSFKYGRVKHNETELVRG